jgi:hypothetical protein
MKTSELARVEQVEHKTSDRRPFLLLCQRNPSGSATGQMSHGQIQAKSSAEEIR